MRLRALGLKKPDCVTLTAKNQWKGTVASVTLELSNAPIAGKNLLLISIAQKDDETSVVLKLTPPKGKSISAVAERNKRGQHVVEATLNMQGKWQAKVEVRNGKRQVKALFEFLVVD